MLRNYLIIALRNLKKGLASTIGQSLGLAIGLAVFILVNLIAQFEENFDTFFKNSERIYTVYIDINPEAGFGFKSTDGIQTAMQPLIELNIPEIEKSARLLGREYVVKSEDAKFYQSMSFADPEFFDIINLDFTLGDPAGLLTDPSSVAMSQSVAEKYFGNSNPIGNTITVDNKHDLKVTAVYSELPSNTHFAESITSGESLKMVAGIGALTRISNFDPVGTWSSLNSEEKTYVLLPAGADPVQFESKFLPIYEEHMNEELKEMVDGFHLRPLRNMNLFVWETSGIPALGALRTLGLIILLIACLNYMTLAAARGMGRMREVGMRKTLGATRNQLIIQFLVESVTIAFVALVLAVFMTKISIPFITQITTRELVFDVFSDPMILGGLITLMLITGIFSGGYPAWVVSRFSIINALNESMGSNTKKNIMRNILLTTQYTASIVLAVAVMVTYAQNKKLQSGAFAYHREHVVLVQRVDNTSITPHYEALKAGWLASPDITQVSLASQVPFQQSTSISQFTPVAGDKNLKVDLQTLNVDKEYIDLYDIELLAGRNLTDEFGDDSFTLDTSNSITQATVNVLINEKAVAALNFDSPVDAIDKLFYDVDEENAGTSFRVVGVVEDVNYMGFFSNLRPTLFWQPDQRRRVVSILTNTDNLPGTLAYIDQVWDEVLPDYPIDRNFLNDNFDEIYSIFEGINAALVLFSVIGLSLALTGLFAMTIYLTNNRTKEVGVRKVLGASVPRLMSMLGYQITKPVLVSVIIACPLAYLSMGAYLNFFTDKVDLPVTFFIKIGVVVMMIAWLVVGLRTYGVANTNPADVLRDE